MWHPKGRNRNNRRKFKGKNFIKITDENRVRASGKDSETKSAGIESCSYRPCRQDTIGKIIKFIIILIPAIVILRFMIMNTSIFFRTTYSLPFSLHLNRQDLVLEKGEEFKLYVYGINKRVSYSSTNFRIVGVNFNGRLYAYQTGKAFILVKVDHKILKCRVRVIDINKEKLVLKAGRSGRLRIKGISLTTFPRYKSGDKSIAAVNCFGRVTAKRKGTTVITVKVKGKVFLCKVVVQ